MSITDAGTRSTAQFAAFDSLTVPGPDAAAYIEKLCQELAGLADRAGLGFLAYLLEVAREEAVLHAEDATPVSLHGEAPDL